MPGGSRAIRQLTEKQLPRRPVLLALALVSALVSTGSFTSVARGTAVFVSNFGSDSVSAFSIGANGALSPIVCNPTSNCSTGTLPYGVAVGPSGRFLYTANGSGTVSPFSVNADDSLAPIACSPASNCTAGTTPTGVAVSPSERFLYVTSGGGSDKVSVFAIDTDGSLSPIPCNPPSNCNTGAAPYGVAVSPSGQYLYVTNFSSSSVSVFAVNSDGSLLPLPCNPMSNCSTGTGQPTGVAITPSGRFLYVTNRTGSNTVSVFAVNADGSLTPVACNPTSNCNTGANPYSLAVSPSGSFLYVTNYGSSTVSVFAIGSDGSLTPVACASNCNTGTTPTGVAVSPSGGFLYVASHASTMSVFAINSDGSLTPVGCDPASNCNTGIDPDFQSVAAQPDQGPRAVFGVRAGRRGVPTGFDGSASSDSDGSVVRYDWDFGDGTTAANGGVALTHRYARNGRYTVKLTVTDGTGCSTALVFTGQTASCNGSSAASRSQPVGVDVMLPKISGMKVVPGVIASTRRAQIAKRRKLPRSGTIRYRLSERAIVALGLERRTLGRRVGKRCRKATRSLRKRRACVRYVRIGRGLTQKGKKGRNGLRFSARTLEVHKLRAARYRVVARATDAFGNRSRTKHTTFRVAKRR